MLQCYHLTVMSTWPPPRGCNGTDSSLQMKGRHNWVCLKAWLVWWWETLERALVEATTYHIERDRSIQLVLSFPYFQCSPAARRQPMKAFSHAARSTARIGSPCLPRQTGIGLGSVVNFILVHSLYVWMQRTVRHHIPSMPTYLPRAAWTIFSRRNSIEQSQLFAQPTCYYSCKLQVFGALIISGHFQSVTLTHYLPNQVYLHGIWLLLSRPDTSG